MTPEINKPIADYWLAHYADKYCTLCGNSGIIDTSGVMTTRGIPVGKKNYCICPNGQTLRWFDPDGQNLDRIPDGKTA